MYFRPLDVNKDIFALNFNVRQPKSQKKIVSKNSKRRIPVVTNDYQIGVLKSGRDELSI